MPIHFEKGGLYVVLRRPDGPGLDYRWILVIFHGGGWGQVYHVTDGYFSSPNPTDADGRWRFETFKHDQLQNSTTFAAVLRIGDGFSGESQATFEAILHGVPSNMPNSHFDDKWQRTFTSRVWVLEALDRLHQHKIISKTAQEIEKFGQDVAEWNEVAGRDIDVHVL